MLNLILIINLILFSNYILSTNHYDKINNHISQRNKSCKTNKRNINKRKAKIKVENIKNIFAKAILLNINNSKNKNRLTYEKRLGINYKYLKKTSFYLQILYIYL